MKTSSLVWNPRCLVGKYIYVTNRIYNWKLLGKSYLDRNGKIHFVQFWKFIVTPKYSITSIRYIEHFMDSHVDTVIMATKVYELSKWGHLVVTLHNKS